MKRIALLCVLSLCLALFPAFDPAAAEKKDDVTKVYKGAWFELKYPSGFTVRPSIASTGVPGAYDSAFFASPDKKVEFYIFSPQWSGDATDIAFDEKAEKKDAPEVQKKDGREVTYYTIRARDGSYVRIYQQTVENDATVKWIVGLKYAGQKDYEKYKAAYLEFKGSLRQFAD